MNIFLIHIHTYYVLDYGISFNSNENYHSKAQQKHFKRWKATGITQLNLKTHSVQEKNWKGWKKLQQKGKPHQGYIICTAVRAVPECGWKSVKESKRTQTIKYKKKLLDFSFGFGEHKIKAQRIKSTYTKLNYSNNEYILRWKMKLKMKL